jgi:hypothetical protein
MKERARRGEAHRSGLDRLADDARHLLEIAVGRRFAVDAALAHHVDAHGGVRHVAADVHVVAARRKKVEILGYDSHVQGKPSASTGCGMSSTPSISRISISC